MNDDVCPNCSETVPADAHECVSCGSVVDRTATFLASPPPLPEDRFADLGPGRVFAERFTIIERIGSGGMGVVYKAIDRTLDTEVALKLIRQELGGNAVHVERFKREVRVTRRITHPNICRVHDIGQSDEVLFLSMEWIEGETLAQLVRKAGTLREDRALAIAERIARALEVAHAEGVVHRDLKPANVMVDRRGHVRVMDFGLAQEQHSERLSRTGALVGTPLYMAPEQRAGREVDSRTDLYALGLILREMLTGQRFSSFSTPHDPPDAGVNPAIAPVLRTLLADVPDDRYASAAEVRTVLNELRGSDAISSPSAAISTSISQPGSSRRPALWIGGAVVLVALLFGGWWFLGGAANPDGLDKEAAFHFERGVQSLQEDTDSPRVLGDAISSFNRARREAPDSALVLARLGEAYWRRFLLTGTQDARDDAERTVQEAYDLDPGLPEVLNARALGFIAEADYASALNDLEKAVAASPGFYEAWAHLGEAQQALGNYGESREAYERAIELEPQRASLRIHLGLLHDQLGEYDAALKHYREAVDLSPEDVMAVNNLGAAYLFTASYVEAIPIFLRSIEIEETATAVSNLGTSYYFVGDYEGAVEQYRRATVLEPEKAVHWGNLGDAWLALGDDVRTRESFVRAADLARERIDENANNPGARAQLALYCAKARREDCAVVNGAKATDLQPDNPRFLRINAVVHAMFGRTRDCLDYLEQAVTFGCSKAEIDATPEFSVLRDDPRFEKIYARAD